MLTQPPKIKKQPAFKPVIAAVEEYVQALEDSPTLEEIEAHEQTILQTVLENTIGAEGVDYIERLKDRL